MLDFFQLVLVISSFLFAHLLNYLSYFARIAGKKLKYPLLGTSLGGIFIGGSSVSLLIFIPSVSFLIETSALDIKTYFKLFSIIFFFTALSIYLAFLKRNFIITIMSKILYCHVNKRINILLSCLNFWMYDDIKVKKIKNSNKLKYHSKMIITSVIAYIMISGGYFIAFYLAINFIEYRLTISSVALVIHSIGSILLLTVIDPKLNSHIDKMSISTSWSVINSFFISRFISLMILFLFTVICLALIL
tara:strand:- start:17219 stop:17959 length:741 start_codon:yes stop_codon:yes gene_type:complete